VLDGEVVALDELDRPSFSRLQQRMHQEDPAALKRLVREVPVYYFVFDVLYLDGRNLMRLPFARRRDILEELTIVGPSWQRSPTVIGDGEPVLESAKQLGLEGIVAKRLDGGYDAGKRSSAWLKLKLVRRQEFVIGGWLPESSGLGRIGALLLGYYELPTAPGERPKFRFTGKVGSGLVKEAEQKRLRPLFTKLARNTSPFDDKLPNFKGPRFVEPQILAEVEFRGITEAGMLFQPAFKGIRTDKSACEVTRRE
jgi:bifunctional non-homologous end joining protein LigD